MNENKNKVTENYSQNITQSNFYWCKDSRHYFLACMNIRSHQYPRPEKIHSFIATAILMKLYRI